MPATTARIIRAAAPTEPPIAAFLLVVGPFDEAAGGTETVGELYSDAVTYAPLGNYEALGVDSI
jgi:hypothetical protein